ncbi:hypothetical protein OPS25_05185 [Alteromonas ponticola]|uniref:Uncharacterized protein n=1 Tax=Alteromonas aquimaris TaxID=2998417 RepID=A0ABT3P550_9ALTE|nr:hypothetical protein [Alteromonas aquimaris]
MQVNVNSDCLEPAPSTAVIAKTKVNGLSAGVFNALELPWRLKLMRYGLQDIPQDGQSVS